MLLSYNNMKRGPFALPSESGISDATSTGFGRIRVPIQSTAVASAEGSRSYLRSREVEETSRELSRDGHVKMADVP